MGGEIGKRVVATPAHIGEMPCLQVRVLPHSQAAPRPPDRFLVGALVGSWGSGDPEGRVILMADNGYM